jgi:hypothetical protein
MSGAVLGPMPMAIVKAPTSVPSSAKPCTASPTLRVQAGLEALRRALERLPEPRGGPASGHS